MARTATIRKQNGKQKRTYSLSAESVAFVAVVAERIQTSASEALERLIQEKKAQTEREQIAAKIRKYYDSLSGEE